MTQQGVEEKKRKKGEGEKRHTQIKKTEKELQREQSLEARGVEDLTEAAERPYSCCDFVDHTQGVFGSAAISCVRSHRAERVTQLAARETVIGAGVGQKSEGARDTSA